jgi:hypothetical protein
MDEDIGFRLKERSPLAILNDLSVDTDVVGMVKKLVSIILDTKIYFVSNIPKR